MTIQKFKTWLSERIVELDDIVQNHPYVDDWLFHYGGMLVRQAGRIASEFGLFDVYEQCRVRHASPPDAAALLRFCLSRLPDEPLPTQATHSYLTPPEVAGILRVRYEKVLAWIRRGRLRASYMSENRGGRPRYRIEWSNLQAFIQNRQATSAPTRRRPRPPPEGVTEYF